MAAGDIKFKFSTKSGSAINSEAGTASGSLGKYISTTEITDATLHNLFDVIAGAENLASKSECRCVFVHDANAADDFLDVKVYIHSQVAGGANAEIGVDPTAASAVGSASAQAVEIADEDTAPTGVTFTVPETYETGLDIGDLTAGQVKAFWVKRTTTNSAALENDGVTTRVQGESL